MPIIAADAKLAQALGAWSIPTLTAQQALHQDARPLSVLLLTLDADQLPCDLRIARLLSNSPIQIDLTLLRAGGADPSGEIAAHLLQFYRSFSEVREGRFDGLVIIGSTRPEAASALTPASPGVAEIIAWSRSRVRACLFVDRGAAVGLRQVQDVPPVVCSVPLSGVHAHRVLRPGAAILAGHDAHFDVPVVRNWEVSPQALAVNKGLSVLIASPSAGVHLLRDEHRRHTYLVNDIAIDAAAAARDLGRRATASISAGAGGGSAAATPVHGWRAHVHLLFANWLASDVLPC